MVWQPCWMTERFVLSSNMAAMPLCFWISTDWLQTKNMQYIGETKRHLSDRFGEHRRTIKKAIQQRHINQSTAVSDHFSLPGHSINNIELITLELIKSNRDGIRKAKEALLISKGKTIEPHGIEDPIFPIMHCALATIGGHFLDVEKSESWCWYLKSVCIANATDITVLLGIGSSALITKEHF